MSQSLLKLRQSLGEFAVGKTDEDLLASLAQATGRSIGQVADAYQYAPTESGQWGNRVSGAIDSYQAGLWGVGEALGSETAGRMRRTNEFQANLARERASNQGAVMSYKDVDSLGSAANYVGGLLVDSAPYLGEAVVGGIAGRAVAGGLGLAAKGVSNAKRAGAVAASYPSAVGDILQNQRDQAGTTDVGSAALLGIPYAAANMFGLEGAAGRLSGFRNTVKALDGVRGVTGGALRTAATVGGVGLTEGFSELGQEFINQAGRNVVDPNAGYFGPEAMDRYTESFIGGAALGGTMGGAAGGWRRSTPELPAPTPTDGVPPSNQFKDLMAGPPNLPGLLQGPPREAMYEQVETNPPAAPGVFLDSTGNYSLLDPTDAPQAVGRPVARGLMQGPPEPLMQVGLGARDYGFKYGDQGVLFDMPGAAPPVALNEATVAAPVDTATPDMFPPGSPQMARTMFNPMSEPTTPMESALRPRTQGRGAVPAEISAQINRMVGGKPDPYSVKVAIEMSRAMDTRSVPQYIAEQRAALNKRMGKRYDITFGRDGPARAELEVLDEKDRQKYAILDAAEALSNRLLATEGAAQARPGMMVVARPEMGQGTELEMRQRNATEPLTEPTVEAPAAQAAEPVVEAVAESAQEGAVPRPDGYTPEQAALRRAGARALAEFRKRRYEFGRALGAVDNNRGQYLTGRHNRKAVTAAAKGDWDGFTDALASSKNAIVSHVGKLAKGLKGAKVKVDDGARESKSVDVNVGTGHGNHTAAIQLEMLDRLREIQSLGDASERVGALRSTPLKALDAYIEAEEGTRHRDSNLIDGSFFAGLNRSMVMDSDIDAAIANLERDIEALGGEEEARRIASNAHTRTIDVTAVAGAYDPETRTVALNSDPRLGGSENAQAHEVVHALAVEAVANPTAKQRPVVQRLSALYEHVKAKDIRDGNNREFYGLSTLQEFVAEGLSNPEFQFYLSQTAYENTTAWGKFTQYIAQLLGLEPDNAFTEFLALSEELLGKPKGKTNASVADAPAAPAPAATFDFDAVEQALTQERDATTNEIEDGWMQGGDRRQRTPLEAAIYDAVTTSTLTAEEARAVFDVAVAAGRLDLAEYAVRRAERAAESMGTTPGVSKDSPKYEAIKQDLERRKAEATEQAAALRRDLNEQKKQQGSQNGNTTQDAQRGDDREGAPAAAGGGRESQDAPRGGRGDQGDGTARAAAGTEGPAAELTPSKFADLERAFDEAQTAQALAFSKLQVANTNNARPAEIRRLKKARDAATAKFEKARDALEMAREADGVDLTTEDAPVDRELNEDDKADIALLDSEAAGADAAKTQVELNRRIDAIYSMFMEADSTKVREHARKILDDGFTAKDLADARERFERAQRFRSDTTSPLSPDQQLPQEALQGVVDRALSRTKTPPKVVILSDASEMPGGPPPAGVNPSGALRRGVIYLFRNMIGSEVEASRTLFHELFHYGLNRLLPREEYASMMRKLYDNNAKVREYALRWKASADGQASKAGRNSASWDALAVEEALADIAEDINSGMKLRLRQLASWLADVAQRLGFTNLAQSIRRMPLNEVEQYVADTIQGALDWNGRKPPGDGGNETTYSSPRTPDNGLSAPPKAMSTLRSMYENAAGGWRTMPGALGWLTNGQIGDRFKFAAKATELVSQMSAAARRLMGESHSIDLDWAKIKAPERVQRAMLETTLQKMYILRPGTDPNNPEYVPLGQGGNKHLDPNDELLKDKYASLRAEFEAMSPLERKVYLDAQAKLSRDWEMMGELIKQSIVRAYEPTLGAAMRNPRLAGKFEELFGAKSLEELADLPARKRDVADARSNEIFRSLSPAIRNDIRALWSDVAEHSERLAQMQGPYFPLVRFGDYVVAFKSPRLIEERAELDRLQAELQELLQTEPDDPAGLDEQIAEAKKAVRKQRGIVESIQSNERDYVVEFHESRREAIAAFEQRKAEMLRLGASEEEVADQLRWERRTDYNARLDGASPAFLDKLESALTSSLPTAEANAVKASIRDIYIQSMPERSALKAQLRRIGAAGVKSGEMRRAFAFATLRNAWRLSRLQYGREINDEVNSLRLSSDEDRKLVGAELGKRLAHSMQFDSGNRIADVIANTGYIWHLGMSPAFLITNLMQPWVVSAPVMAAKFGSIGRTTNELRRATAEVGRHVLAQMRKDGFHFELNTAAFKGPGEAEMLASMFDKGKIDITLEHDLGAVAAGSTETLFGKVARMAAWPAHHTEVVNRVATALATYRLARARGMSDTQARSAVVSILDDTHLDYTPENAPRLMRSDALGGFGRVVFQFKKYSQGMLYLLAKNGLDMVRGDKEAGKALMYLLGVQVAVAGTAGLPVVPVVGLIAAAASKAWDDDDEPELLAMLYSGLQDAIGKDAARAIAKGLPAALLNTDVSGQVGMGSIANPFAFANLDSKQGADAVAHATLALMGPAFGLAARWAEATVVAEKGDYVKATAMALPKVMSNIVQAADVGTRGLTTRNGDVLLTLEEAGLIGIPRRALGFQSTDATDIYDRRAAFYKMRGNRDEVRSELIRERSRATGDASELDQQIAEFNERHPESRIRPKDWLNRRKEELAKGSRLRQGLPATERDAPIAARLGVQ